MAMDLPFDIAGGSVAGRAHVAAGRNNQDAFYWTASAEGLVAVVCDGCSSGLHSEVGAKVGARLVAQVAARLCTAKLGAEEMLERVRLDVLARLRLLAAEMGGDSFQRTVSEFLLFTVVGLYMTPTAVTTFSIGDGLVVVNGDRHRIGPFENNEPPYLGYGLLSRGPSFRIHDSIPTGDVRRLVLGTDGAFDLDTEGDEEPLEAICLDDRTFRNADMVRRRLTIMRNERRGVFADDTTLVVVRRKPGDA
jgi:hypothetical protein